MQSTVNALMGGMVAGLAGTAVMMGTRMASEKYLPGSVVKTRKDPGEFMVRAAEHVTGTLRLVPEPVERSAAMATHVGYGTMFGILYGLLSSGRRNRSRVGDGVLLGMAVYAAGHLGWLPAIGLERPVWKQKFTEIAGELGRHVMYGVATTEAFGVINSALETSM